FERSCSAASATGQRAKRRGITDAPDQAERLARPLPRRRRITARPPRVRIRIRNPCFLLRLRLFGWNVLFTHGLLERPGPRTRWSLGGGAPPPLSARQLARSARGQRGSVRPNACTRQSGRVTTANPRVASRSDW